MRARVICDVYDRRSQISVFGAGPPQRIQKACKERGEWVNSARSLAQASELVSCLAPRLAQSSCARSNRNRLQNIQRKHAWRCQDELAEEELPDETTVASASRIEGPHVDMLTQMNSTCFDGKRQQKQ